MTNEEAKELLENISAYDIDSQRGKDKQATIEQAIKALETVERIEERKRELEKKVRSGLSFRDFSEAIEHYALVKLLREGEDD